MSDLFSNDFIVLIIINIIALPIIYLFYRYIVKEILRGGDEQDICASCSDTHIYAITIIAGITILYAIYSEYNTLAALCFAAIFSSSLLLLSAIDLRTQFLPDIITKPLIILGLIQGYLGIFTDITSSALGAIFGYGILWGINSVFRYIRGIDGMGYGDFKLLSAIGAWTGAEMLVLSLLLSSFIGIFLALVINASSGRKFRAPVPFGPSLAIAGIVSLLYGEKIINWYLNILTG